jgi:hypothetical protein
MDYASADPSVVRSIRQRVLLNGWLRAQRKPNRLPALTEFDPEAGLDEFDDMMGFDIEGEDESARFLITLEGPRLAAAYGSTHVAPAARTNRYLDDAIGPYLYARVVSCYRECVARKRPIYSITAITDPDGKDVTYERLLLPFGNGYAVKHIIGSYKTISVEGGFKVDNLMGRKMTTPTRLVTAAIDRDLQRRPASVRASDDIVEVG